MTHTDLLTLSGGLAMAGLGLRHALDPDHVATVDGIAFGLLERAPRLAPWVGTLFALGHGLVVTAIAAAVAHLGRAGGWLAAPPALVAWLPLGLLLLVGVLNLKALLAPHDHGYAPISLKGRLLPKRLRMDDPVAILLTGVVFAFMLDSAATAAAIGYAAGGVGTALGAGAVFTAGMAVSATIYGQAMTRLLRATATHAEAERYRRGVGWATVVLSFGVVAYMTACHFFPGLEVEEETMIMAGGAFVAALAAAAGWATWRARGAAGAGRGGSVTFAPAREASALPRLRRVGLAAARPRTRV